MAEDSSAPSMADDVIDVPYLLALNVGAVKGPDGHYYADRSWAKDLVRHFTYLPRLTFLAPVEHREPPAGFVRLPVETIRLVDYRIGEGRTGYLRTLPALLAILWREIGRSAVVHTAVAGHPVPIGWFAVPMAKLRGRRVVLVIESAFWRLTPDEPADLRRKLRSAVWERVNRAIMRRVDHAFYSHDQYRTSLPARRALTSVTAQASWIDAEAVLSADEVGRRWSRRIAQGDPPRFLFAARMIRAKGTAVLLDAIDRLDMAAAQVGIDIVGSGPELDGMMERVRRGGAADRVGLLDPVPYGSAFMELLTRYDAILVPSLSDEQPRIVYDAYSQGVPVIASDVPGLRMCVKPEVTGRLVSPGDAEALAAAISDVAGRRDRSREWALAGRDIAIHVTHDRMHRDRAALLAPFYPPRSR